MSTEQMFRRFILKIDRESEKYTQLCELLKKLSREEIRLLLECLEINSNVNE